MADDMANLTGDTGHHDKDSGYYENFGAEVADLLTADVTELTGPVVGGSSVTSLTGENLSVDAGSLSAEHDHTSETINPHTVNASVTDSQELFVSDLLNVTPKSTTPSSPSTNDIYLDDGTNTSDSVVGFRYYDGSAWIDL